MHFKSPAEWSEWINSIHEKKMDMSLDRIKHVAEKLNLLSPKAAVITVAGTNGKGSSVAGLERIYLEAGYKVGAFTSPYLFRINELIRVQGQEVEDDALCSAFEEIEKARNQVRLTPFEFNTLAAFIIFQKSQLDIWILEVGLGGRLDAVNVLSADAVMIASIDLDHADWLGNTRDLIAREKAGVFRKNKPAVYGDLFPPVSLLEYARELDIPLYCQGRDFSFHAFEKDWSWEYGDKKLEHLPISSLSLENMANVLMLIEIMQNQLPVQESAIKNALREIKLPGRIQVIPGDITRVYDVAHNPAAIAWLADYLRKTPVHGKTKAVFSMLADKDILSSILAAHAEVDEWHIAPLRCDRAASIAVLEYCFRRAEIPIKSYTAINDAYKRAFQESHFGDRIIVFGSFHTVAEAGIDGI